MNLFLFIVLIVFLVASALQKRILKLHLYITNHVMYVITMSYLFIYNIQTYSFYYTNTSWCQLVSVTGDAPTSLVAEDSVVSLARRSVFASPLHGEVPFVHQAVATGGKVELLSPTPSAHSVSSVS